MSLINSNEGIMQMDKNFGSDKGFFQGQFQSDTIVRDPLVSGFAFIKWLNTPEWVTKEYAAFKAMTEKNLRAFSGINDIEMNTFAIQEGFTGSENMFAGGAQMFQGFSMTHREYSGSPIRNAYTHWVTGVRDPVTGIATYPKKYGKEYSAANHTGELLYVMTRPDVDNTGNAKVIEFACLYTMVMPTKVPLGHLNFTAGSNDGTEIEMSFVGVPHIGKAVNDLAIAQLKSSERYEFMNAGDFKYEK
jgi:hypothetical protein